ncbi:Quinoprotein alcohol dehydrogenase-like domain [Acididesulfobacillus acetoxydans]|uniref:Quinonprotein alcohol dehydrogenase-like superfamily n=1 Tax=Acididesulfobacillus acetoxydans TaxID=1561005 RepID=A0A8S0XXM2_9FIRM|nr:hypothetical protein [Acididesulfobacillus acetoxydans]CAA7601867.1 Quinoprotein alcohol dehydrogenase-like domain [Acididesulfobacillus acetoxydans]CEJ08289.1 Quinonprotein alcohol dehydrogenase-like superfamily [Acididesulfobacillus acetoxydans]
MKRKWRTLGVWVVISLILQFSAYAFVNKKVQAVLAPRPVKPPITETLTADIPGTHLQDIQLSYAKDYVAYKENGVLKVYNLKLKKVVFEKPPAAGSGKNMGVLAYEWLPDRNTLIYFYARKNPHPVTYTVIQPPSQPAQPSPEAPVKEPSPTAQASSGKAGRTLPKTEDLNQQSKNSEAKAKSVTPKTHTANQAAPPAPKPIVKKHYNPQLTDVYTLTLPESTDKTTEPDDRFNETLDSKWFPAGGQIMQMDFSTFTNLIYVLIKDGSTNVLLRIDVMKELQHLNEPGENISNMTVSGRYGTLYIDTTVGGRKEIVALDAVHGWQRTLISRNPDYVLLGDKSGILYIGDVKDGNIVKILTMTETGSEKTLPQLTTEWTGTIPFRQARVQMGAHNEVIIYNAGKAYIVDKGRLKSVNLQGSDNYISPDGAELVQMTEEGNMTHFELKPWSA